MKTFAYKFGVLAMTVLMMANAANAQQKKYLSDPKYGPDSAAREACAMHISLYGEFYKQKNYKDAVNDWRKVFQNCPAASKNTFIRGATIYKSLIKDSHLIKTLQSLYLLLFCVDTKYRSVPGHIRNKCCENILYNRCSCDQVKRLENHSNLSSKSSELLS